MKVLRGNFYDGKTSTIHRVTIYLEGPWVHVVGDGVDLRCAVSDIRIGEQLGSLPRPILFSNGARCDLEDGEALDVILGQQNTGTFYRLLHLWENRIGYVFMAFALIIGIVWWAVQFGIPWTAKRVAYSLPAATEDILGRDALAVLDRTLFGPTTLPEIKRRELTDEFGKMVNTLPDRGKYRLEFRSGKRVGPNAFALPSGIVVVTDEMVALAESREELIGVFAHEIGHVKYRHSLRHVLQNSASGLLIAAITGDILSASALAAALPTILVDAKFSREFEREADAAAAEYLKVHNISPEHLANLLARLEAQEGGKGERVSFLSSHPATKERVELIKESR